MDDKKARFSLGNIVFTCEVNTRVSEDEGFAKFVLQGLRRHATGDWGDMSEQDKRENEYALGKYLRIFSSYNYQDEKVWIITEADRRSTTILFPSEY